MVLDNLQSFARRSMGIAGRSQADFSRFRWTWYEASGYPVWSVFHPLAWEETITLRYTLLVLYLSIALTLLIGSRFSRFAVLTTLLSVYVPMFLLAQELGVTPDEDRLALTTDLCEDWHRAVRLWQTKIGTLSRRQLRAPKGCKYLLELGEYEIPPPDPEPVQEPVSWFPTFSVPRWGTSTSEIVKPLARYWTVELDIVQLILCLAAGWVTVTAVLHLIGKRLRRSRVTVTAPMWNFTHRDVTIGLTKRINDARNAIQPNLANGHALLAHERATLEKGCLDWLAAVSPFTRDIGGSLTRHAARGPDHHVCFPRLDDADHARWQYAQGRMENDIGLHTGQDCPVSNRLSMMSDVDYHMTEDELVRAIRAPTLIITHDFVALEDKPQTDWCDGEATVLVRGGLVCMTVRGGESYVHNYHRWQNEGTVATTSGAFRYDRVFTSDHSIVLYCVPVSGDYRVKTSLGRKAHRIEDIKVASGHPLIVSRGQLLVDGVGYDVSMLMTVAFSQSTAARDDKWLANLKSVLRAKLTAAEANNLHIDVVQEVVVKLADQMALDAPISVITGDPANLSWFQRYVLRWLMWSGLAAPKAIARFLQWAVPRVSDWLAGRSPLTARMSGAWTEVRVPTYEVVWAQVQTVLTDTRRSATQPFRVPRQDAPAALPQSDNRPARTHRGEPDRRDREEGASGGAAAPSRPGPVERRSKPVSHGPARPAAGASGGGRGGSGGSDRPAIQPAPGTPGASAPSGGPSVEKKKRRRTRKKRAAAVGSEGAEARPAELKGNPSVSKPAVSQPPTGSGLLGGAPAKAVAAPKPPKAKGPKKQRSRSQSLSRHELGDLLRRIAALEGLGAVPTRGQSGSGARPKQARSPTPVLEYAPRSPDLSEQLGDLSVSDKYTAADFGLDVPTVSAAPSYHAVPPPAVYHPGGAGGAGPTRPPHPTPRTQGRGQRPARVQSAVRGGPGGQRAQAAGARGLPVPYKVKTA
ncbi:hypothetical protein 1 [Beihai tombus-like virus 19]|uniref:hypothetical protein 1 n=1 Tax=Beihai tombus-like virus 19 TaxID=1922722 RepID=UPI00090AC3E5|nr:hypothetical protein 1 [Beihai tombus-like virus 19]APG76133.1 hypothetical protein 1 [Beihai tombus-like virus 19]